MQLAGELAKINFPSLIQMVRNGKLTGKICLTHGVSTAFIYVDEGRIFHVETDQLEGREALLDLFLWTGGTFSFVDCPIDNIPPSISADESLDKLVKEGVAYAEARSYLDRLRINPHTVLTPLSGKADPGDPVLSAIDGRTSIRELADRVNISSSGLTQSLKKIISAGLAVVSDAQAEDSEIKLPDWVVSRLSQDNPDISKAIVDMVIWVDRIKCWMYQTDADLERVIGAMEDQSAHAAADGGMPRSGIRE